MLNSSKNKAHKNHWFFLKKISRPFPQEHINLCTLSGTATPPKHLCSWESSSDMELLHLIFITGCLEKSSGWAVIKLNRTVQISLEFFASANSPRIFGCRFISAANSCSEILVCL